MNKMTFIPLAGLLIIAVLILNARIYGNDNELCTQLSSTAQLTDTLSLISIVESFMATNHRPGLQVSVIRDGQRLWQRSFGLKSVIDSSALTDTTLCVLGSTSKLFTGVAFMQLVEDGIIDLDENINEYLPFNVINPNYPLEPITPRMLLAHVSSIRDNSSIWPPFIVGDNTEITIGDFSEGFLVSGGDYYSLSNYHTFEPGTAWDYCNVGITLCAYIVEYMTGMSFEEYCQQSVFQPSGMNETSFFLSGIDTTLLADVYFWDGTSDYRTFPHWGHPTYPSADLKTSLDQLTNFAEMILNNGEFESIDVLDSVTLAEMQTVQYPTIPQGGGYGSKWGLVFWTKLWSGRTLWGHEGLTLGFRTLLYTCPAENSAVTIIALGQPSTNSDFTMISLSKYFFDFAAEQQDVDEDGVFDILDNCPNHYNPDQSDVDMDGIGDVCEYPCGDTNGDYAINIGDAVYLVNFIFKFGPQPPGTEAADANADGSINIGDAVYLINYIFRGGPAPCQSN